MSVGSSRGTGCASRKDAAGHRVAHCSVVHRDFSLAVKWARENKVILKIYGSNKNKKITINVNEADRRVVHIVKKATQR